jgi:flagellar biogenesis protein FliO
MQNKINRNPMVDFDNESAKDLILSTIGQLFLIILLILFCCWACPIRSVG